VQQVAQPPLGGPLRHPIPRAPHEGSIGSMDSALHPLQLRRGPGRSLSVLKAGACPIRTVASGRLDSGHGGGISASHRNGSSGNNQSGDKHGASHSARLARDRRTVDPLSVRARAGPPAINQSSTPTRQRGTGDVAPKPPMPRSFCADAADRICTPGYRRPSTRLVQVTDMTRADPGEAPGRRHRGAHRFPR
jgi:hypothetical protein